MPRKYVSILLDMCVWYTGYVPILSISISFCNSCPVQWDFLCQYISLSWITCVLLIMLLTLDLWYLLLPTWRWRKFLSLFLIWLDVSTILLGRYKYFLYLFLYKFQLFFVSSWNFGISVILCIIHTTYSDIEYKDDFLYCFFCSEFNMPNQNQIVLLKLMEALCQGRRKRSKRRKVNVPIYVLFLNILSFIFLTLYY